MHWYYIYRGGVASTGRGTSVPPRRNCTATQATAKAKAREYMVIICCVIESVFVLQRKNSVLGQERLGVPFIVVFPTGLPHLSIVSDRPCLKTAHNNLGP